jgi:hypothetical protein
MGAPLPAGQASLRPASPCPCSTASPDPPDRGGAAGFAPSSLGRPARALLRRIHVVVTRHVSWGPATAAEASLAPDWADPEHHQLELD